MVVVLVVENFEVHERDSHVHSLMMTLDGLLFHFSLELDISRLMS